MHGGWPAGLDDEIAKHVVQAREGDGPQARRPARSVAGVSVRSGAKFSMPGMMDTVLNLGLNDESVKGLAKVTDDERFAYDSLPALHRDVRPDRARRRRRAVRAPARGRQGAAPASKTDAELPAAELKQLCKPLQGRRQEGDRQAVPAAPDARSSRGAVEAVFRSWNGARAIAYRVREKISHDLGTAVNVQTMVFGNRDDNSGTGVGFTRNAATGENTPYGDFLINAQGEDVVAGIRNTEDLDAHRRALPGDPQGAARRSSSASSAHYRDMCDTEFTIEQGKLWMLQTRVGKRTGAAALRMAVDMTKGTRRGGAASGRSASDEAVMRVTADHLDSVLHPQFDGQGQGARQGPRRVAGRRRRQGVLHRRRGRGRRCREGREGRSSCATRRAPRTCTG